MKVHRIDIEKHSFELYEDAYRTLEDYIKSVEEYYALFEEGEELLSDIKDRIAEWLLEVKSKQGIISKSDVDFLIKQMGTVDIFAQEIQHELHKKKAQERLPQGRRLYRDLRHRFIGGVAAGIGNYFSIDATWVRVIWIVFIVSVGFFVNKLFFSSVLVYIILFFFSALVYIILWIIVPGRRDYGEELRPISRLYRSEENRVIGGVAGGVAAYFNVQVFAMRLLFFFLAFTGIFILIYIILWTLIPTGKSYMQKIHMQRFHRGKEDVR